MGRLLEWGVLFKLTILYRETTYQKQIGERPGKGWERPWERLWERCRPMVVLYNTARKHRSLGSDQVRLDQIISVLRVFVKKIRSGHLDQINFATDPPDQCFLAVLYYIV